MSATPSSELDSSTPPSHAPIVLRRDGHGSLLALPRQHLGRTFSAVVEQCSKALNTTHSVQPLSTVIPGHIGESVKIHPLYYAEMIPYVTEIKVLVKRKRYNKIPVFGIVFVVSVVTAFLGLRFLLNHRLLVFFEGFSGGGSVEQSVEAIVKEFGL